MDNKTGSGASPKRNRANATATRERVNYVIEQRLNNMRTCDINVYLMDAYGIGEKQCEKYHTKALAQIRSMPTENFEAQRAEHLAYLKHAVKEAKSTGALGHYFTGMKQIATLLGYEKPAQSDVNLNGSNVTFYIPEKDD